MVDLSFLSKVMHHFSFSGFKRTAAIVAQRSGRFRVVIMADMLRCGLLYGCGYSDYRYLRFETLRRDERKTFLTRGYNNRLVKLLNEPDNHVMFDNKALFLLRFGKFTGREWLDLRKADLSAFIRFLGDKDAVIVKPLDGTCGKGIKKLQRADFASPEEMFREIKREGLSIAEECLVQHPAIAAVYPFSVNTLRIVTIYTGSTVHVVYALIRIGNGGAVVDNFNSGGMCAPIDVETGVITHPAYDKNEKIYGKHPYTLADIVGLQIPLWDKALALCREAAESVPETRYIAWDVCMTEKGPVFVEGNSYPGHDLIQLPPHIEHGKGMLPLFRQYVPEL